MSISFTKKENELHIENLENLYDVKSQKLLEEKNNLVKLMDELALAYQNSEDKSIQKDKDYLELQEKYTRFKDRNITSGERLTELDRFRYEEEIEDLNKSIEKLNGKNKQIDELKQSIVLSSKTANILVGLEKENRGKLEQYLQKIEEKYQELDHDKKSLFEGSFTEVLKNVNASIDTLSYEPLDKEDFEKVSSQLENIDSKLEDIEEKFKDTIDEFKERFNAIKYNPKNKYRLRRISKQIHGFENKLEEIKKEKRKDSKITLKLVEADLEKIESIMNKNKRPIWNIYFKTRFVVVGVMIMTGILILFFNEPCVNWIKNLSLNSIFMQLK